MEGITNSMPYNIDGCKPNRGYANGTVWNCSPSFIFSKMNFFSSVQASAAKHGLAFQGNNRSAPICKLKRTKYKMMLNN